VKTVTQLWKDNESRFEANVVGLFKRVHGAHHTPFIWLVSKEEIDRKFVAIGGTDGVSKGPSLDSVDIGVFGGHFVGEEFKVPAGIGAARVQDYLYRIRFNTDLANRIHEACDKLRTVKTIHAA
jgi:hypothetical protein